MQFKVPQKLQPIFSESLRIKLISLRRDLHQHPELSFCEERTASRLFEEMNHLQPARLDRVAKTGVVARIKGRNSAAPTVAIRGDIDALLIQEATGLDYASINAGVMHACGHDVHAAWAVGAGHLLSENPAEGDVLIVFQPAEETAKGALAVLESGVLDNVSAIYGAHVDRRYEIGEIVVHEGPIAASADMFEIELIGTGSHAGRPHESADPIVGVGALISALQMIVSRRVNPAEPAVVSITTVNAGSAHNIIPDKAVLTGTLRAISMETRQLIQEEVVRISEFVAKTHRLKSNVRLEKGSPPIINPPGPVGWARRAVTTLLGNEAAVPLREMNLAAEDFAYYMIQMPGCFLRIGAREEDGEAIPAHSPYF